MALIRGSKNNLFDFVCELLKHKLVDVNAIGDDGITALMVAIVEENVEVVLELLKHERVDANTQDSIGRTPLFSEVCRDHAQVLSKLLVHESVDVNVKDDDGCTALMLARSMNGRATFVAQLPKHEKPDLNV